MASERIMGRAALAAAAAALACALVLALAPSAYAREVTAPTRPDGTAMTVSDDVTRIHVDKLDARTREAVKGAKMQIVERDTGRVVDEWVTDGTTHAFEKGLDVNVMYVLREAEAPEGYEKIADVEFFANEIEGTGITLVGAHDQAELTDAYKVALLEPHEEIEVVEERVEYVDRVVKTGDRLPVAALAGAAAVAAVAAGASVVLRRKKGE